MLYARVIIFLTITIIHCTMQHDFTVHEYFQSLRLLLIKSGHFDQKHPGGLPNILITFFYKYCDSKLVKRLGNQHNMFPLK